MEKLSATTAIIGLLAVGGKTMEALWDLNTILRDSTPSIGQALAEVKQCRSSVHILFKSLSLLESAKLQFPERGSWIEIDDLIATLADTVLAFSDLQDLCDAVAEMLITTSDYDAVAKKYQQRLTNLCARIRWHNSSMTMMMTILKCPGVSDAQNSRSVLERRMMRLLSSNAELAERMRKLDDVFRTRGTACDALPSYGSAPAVSTRLIERARPSGEFSQRGRVWSVLSGYTLADITVMSIIPLPVNTTEITDGGEFYTFDYARRVSRDLGELMQLEAGQGTSRTLGFILGKSSVVDNAPEAPPTVVVPPVKAAAPVVKPQAQKTQKKRRLWK